MNNSETRHICFFCERWESGGIESFLYNSIRAMDRTACTIDIVVSELHESVFTEPLKAVGVRFFELSGRQQRVLKNHRQFRELLRQERYDVVYLNVFQALSLFCAKAAKQEGVPVRVAHSHNTALRKSATRPLKMLIHTGCKYLFCRDVTAFAACSAAAAAFMFPPSLLRGRGYVFIPNGIDTRRFRFDPEARRQVRERLGLSGRFVVGNVGRLCYQKNQAFLIGMMPELLKKKPDCCLLLIGEGEAMQELKALAERLCLADRVLFCGAVRQVEHYLSAMDAFLFPSRFEGLGIAAVEAQASGLPTIVSENVPAEAGITELFHAEKLDTFLWSEAAAAAGSPARKREDYAALAEEAGFDIASASAGVRRLCDGRSE